MPVRIGLERCVESRLPRLRGRHFGLLANRSSVDRRLRPGHELLAGAFGDGLRAIFAPQHGFASTEQDNMIETPHGFDELLRVPVHSLYERTRRPTAEMLDGLDDFVVDLQDVGARVYTFIWTISLCLEACAEHRVPVIVLDRPNPVGGRAVEGPLLDTNFASFVGRAPVPMRHALTIAELTRHVDRVLGIGAEIEVVEMEGWSRANRWSDLGRVWVSPSPNLPRVEGVDVYPGTVLVEGTSLSEGRGTCTPFEVVGAPWVDATRWRESLEAHRLSGVIFREIAFRPTFQKWCGETCAGLQVHVTDPATFRPYRTAVGLINEARRLWPGELVWQPPPYEYETERMPIDILSGSDDLRVAIDDGASARDLDDLCDVDEESWGEEVRASLLYA